MLTGSRPATSKWHQLMGVSLGDDRAVCMRHRRLPLGDPVASMLGSGLLKALKVTGLHCSLASSKGKTQATLSGFLGEKYSI